MTGVVAPIIIEGTYSVVGSTAVRTGASAIFGAIARNAGRLLNYIGIGAAVGSAIPRTAASGESAAPTPLPGGVGGGNGKPPIIPPRNVPAAGSSNRSNLPVPVTKGQTMATIKPSAIQRTASTNTLTIAKIKGVDLPVVLASGTGKPMLNPSINSPLKGVQPVAAGGAAVMTASQIASEITTNPLKSLGIALGVAAAGMAVYAVAKK